MFTLAKKLRSAGKRGNIIHPIFVNNSCVNTTIRKKIKSQLSVYFPLFLEKALSCRIVRRFSVCSFPVLGLSAPPGTSESLL